MLPSHLISSFNTSKSLLLLLVVKRVSFRIAGLWVLWGGGEVGGHVISLIWILVMSWFRCTVALEWFFWFSLCLLNNVKGWNESKRSYPHSPTHQQKFGLKMYWAWPRPSEQDPDSPTVSLSHQEAPTSLLSSIRGQTEMKTTVTEN